MALQDYTPTAGAKPMGLICLILNLIPITSGIGTIVAGIQDKRNLVRDIIIGVLQLLFFWAIIGWIWSIIWGIFIYQKSPK